MKLSRPYTLVVSFTSEKWIRLAFESSLKVLVIWSFTKLFLSSRVTAPTPGVPYPPVHIRFSSPPPWPFKTLRAGDCLPNSAWSRAGKEMKAEDTPPVTE